MKLAASTLGFRHDDLTTALEAIAATGFDTIDIGAYSSYCPHYDILGTSADDWEGLADLLDSYSLKVATINAGEGLLGDPNSEARAIEGYQKTLQLAERLGCYAITIQSGIDPVTTGDSWDAVADVVAPKFRALCDDAASRGIDIAVEIHKQLLVPGTESALALADKVDHAAFGYTLDPSHLGYAGEDPSEAAKALGGLIRHVHLRDAVGKNILMVPGDGDVDFSSLLKVLEAQGYDRCCTIELEYELARAPEVTRDLERAKALVLPLANWTA